jgi:hypothetical protein
MEDLFKKDLIQTVALRLSYLAGLFPKDTVHIQCRGLRFFSRRVLRTSSIRAAPD